MKAKHCELFLTVSFACIVAGVAVAQTALDMTHGERPQSLDVLLQVPTVENLRDYETELEDSSWAAQAIRPVARTFHFVALNDPGNKVLLGRAGWLFYKPRVDYVVQPSRDDLDKDSGPSLATREIIRVRDQLARRGIHLLVVPVPCKASIYPDKLTRRVVDRELSSRTLEVIHDLQSAEVKVVDLFEVFQRARESRKDDSENSLYLARDTHWSPAGVRIAAEAIALEIANLGLIGPGSVSFRRRAISIERAGDVVQMMRLPNARQFFSTESVRCEQVIEESRPNAHTDDPTSEVLCLGDSFSRIYQTDEPTSAGLIAHLAARLNRPLASIVNDGGASTFVRQQLYRQPKLLAGKKLVVWQFVESDIRFGAEGWKAVALPKQP